MSQTRPNKVIVPINSDAYNLAPDLATMADSIPGVVSVASTTERDTLLASGIKAVFRGDRNAGLQTYDGVNWNGQATSTLLNPNDSNWAVSGGITRTYATGEFSLFRAVGRIRRVAGTSFTITTAGFHNTFTTMIPSGWRPSAYQDFYASLVDDADSPAAQLQGRAGTDGSMIFRVNVGPSSVIINTNWKIIIDCGWWI